MHKIISNTTPIITLLKVDKLNLLKELYGEIIIPSAVYNEIEQGKRKDYYVDLKQLNWIKIRNITNRDSLSYLFELDEGEAEVLILAHELNAGTVIIDELMGRQYAKRLGLKLTGTLGILLKCKEKKLIKTVKPLIDIALNSGIWFNPKLISRVLDLAQEK